MNKDSDNEEFESDMNFWYAFDNLATVSEDTIGEKIEEMIGGEAHSTWRDDSNVLIRLNSEGDEMEETVYLDEEYLTCLTGGLREDPLSWTGAEYGEEYFHSLSELVGNKDKKCNFCKVG